VALSWIVVDTKTGGQRGELPLSVSGDVERTVGASSALSATLDLEDARCPADWENLLDARFNTLVLDDDGHPLNSYVIDQCPFGEATVQIALKSAESLLESVNCWTHDFYEVADPKANPADAAANDEANVAATLLSDVIGPDHGFDLDITLTGKTADHSYSFEEDRTVLSALNDLMEADGGPEWTIRYAWSDDVPARLVKTIHIAPTIGTVIPSTVVDDKHLKSRTRTVATGPGTLATHVIAVSDGSGEYRPMSVPFVDQDALDAGAIRREARVHVTGVDDQDQLNRIGEAGLRRRWSGLTTWAMTLTATEPGCPRPGRDFDAGDTVQIQTGPRVGRITGTVYDSASWHGMARIIGWRAQIVGSTFSTVTPVFWEDKEVGTA
jgi:hypothetical protein